MIPFDKENKRRINQPTNDCTATDDDIMHLVWFGCHLFSYPQMITITYYEDTCNDTL